MLNILGKYRITYYNSVVQEKNLIKQSDYENIIKPKQLEAYQFEFEATGLIKIGKKDEASVLTKKASEIKKEIKSMFGEQYFTNESALGNAINSGILSLPETQGGDTKCEITKL